jgi:hypothetical protein
MTHTYVQFARTASIDRRGKSPIRWVMRSPRDVDDEGMTPSMLRARPSATDGEWMDVAFAAMYAGVPLAVLAAALRDGELPTAAPRGNVSAALVHSHAVESWAVERESRLVPLPG